MNITKEWIEKVIRHNRAGIAAHQLFNEFMIKIDEINSLKETIRKQNELISVLTKDIPKNPRLKQDDDEWESPRERVFRLGRNI